MRTTKYMIALVAGAFLFNVHNVQAEDQWKASGEEKVDHYQVDAPKTKDEALHLLDKHLKNAEAAFAKGDLDGVHHESYYLEAAVDKLRTEKAKDEAALDALDESVQTVHYASEHDEKEKVKTEMPNLKVNAEKVQAVYK